MTCRMRSMIICDDIRQEMSGKEIIIGVFSAGIRFHGPPPGRLRQVFLRSELDLDQSRRFRLRITAPSGVTIADVTQEIELEHPGRVITALRHEDLVLYEEGIYKIESAFDEGPLEETDTLPVTFAPAKTVTAKTTTFPSPPS